MTAAKEKVAEPPTAVHPDHQTKVMAGWMYAASMGLVGFLALQVWGLNGKMERITAQNEARQLMDTERIRTQQSFNRRIEHLIERLENKVDVLAGANNNHKGD